MAADRTDGLKHAQLTNTVLNAFHTVYNTPGYGFLEYVTIRLRIHTRA